jgi:O-antigen ligase
LEQASHTGKYLWLFPSGFSDVYGTFGYYNNFAQLIELTLPITLWEALRTKHVQFQYLLLAALQIGAVVASGSRAGAILVFIELLAVLILAWLKRRESISLTAIALAVFLSAGFTYVAGFHQVVEKLGKSDQLANRRLLNQSSINMIKARPLTGWGLGAYVPVYKAFAVYDDGTWVNQAHNDYLEWAAEGGIPYACILLILILWMVRPAIRSVWAVGLLALCLHALVDYPFARLGACGWFFCLAGMLAAQGNQDPDKREHRRQRSRREPQKEEAQPLSVV